MIACVFDKNAAKEGETGQKTVSEGAGFVPAGLPAGLPAGAAAAGAAALTGKINFGILFFAHRRAVST